jgi:hypothetical protein
VHPGQQQKALIIEHQVQIHNSRSPLYKRGQEGK